MTQKKKLCFLLFMILLVIQVPAFAQNPDDLDQTESAMEEYKRQYILEAGDKVLITIFEDASLSDNGNNIEAIIGDDGSLFLPLVGEVNAKGSTIQQLRSLLRKEYRKYLANPMVNVQVLEYRGLGAYMLGAVNVSGVYAVFPGMSVTQFLTTNGGITSSADLKNVIIVRENDEVIRVNLWSFFEEGDLSQDISVEIGDKIYVPDKKATFLDEVYGVLRFVGLALQIIILITVIGQ